MKGIGGSISGVVIGKQMRISIVNRVVRVIALVMTVACESASDSSGNGVADQGALHDGTTAATISPSGIAPLQVRAELKRSAEFLFRGGYISGGVSLRNSQEGTITLPADPFYPQSASIDAGYLYFTVLASEKDLVREQIYTAELPFLQVKLPSDSGWTEISAAQYPVTMIGTGPTLCWPNTTTSYSYRVDLSRWLRLQAKPPAQVMVKMPWATGTADGSDPWLVGSSPPMLEGASLVVVYRNPASDLNQIVIIDGNDVSLGQALANQINLYPQATAANVKTTFIGADGQSTPAGLAYGPLSMLDGVSAFDGPTVLPWEGSAPRATAFSGGSLWDDLTGRMSLPAGRAQVSASLGSSIDCVSWVAQVISVPRADASLCDVPMYLGADSNNGNQFPPALSCGGEARKPFYAGRIGSVHVEGEGSNASTSWTCYLKKQDDRKGAEPACDGVAEDSMATAGPERTYGFWWVSGPRAGACAGLSRNSACILPVDCGSLPTTVPGYERDARRNGLARFGACQAEMLKHQLDRYGKVIGHSSVLFADLENPRDPPPLWAPCTVRDDAACDDNRAVLYGFLWRAQRLGTTPGVYTRSNFWRNAFEPETERKFVYDPGIDFVLWTAADLGYCNKATAKALTLFPNATFGGMRSVIWQFQEADHERCFVDYDVATQDPATGFTPERAWRPWQTVFTRTAERDDGCPEQKTPRPGCELR